MTNNKDLHIVTEIVPLFDFTLNDFAKEVLINILTEPLGSIAEIISRQEIIKGFIANNNILRSYSYSRLDLSEAREFIAQILRDKADTKSLRLQLVFSEKERHQKRGKFIQLVRLFEKLYSFYISRVDIKTFPEAYKKDLLQIAAFFQVFNLKNYENIIRGRGLKVKHIVDLTNLILEKITIEQFDQFLKSYFLFEAYLSISIGILKYRFTFPEFTDKSFSLQQFYHPLLKNPVKNNLAAESNVIILTGPNMSGKSTFLKAMGLCVYLAHVGLAIPALKAGMPFFKYIAVSINLHDNILSGHSHFMSEVMNLKKVITEAANNPPCFAVFDELFRGTNIEDAVEISTTTIRGLRKFKDSMFIISTHLHQLKDIAEIKSNDITTYYIDCIMKGTTPQFTYELKKGWSDLKVGRLLFDQEGLNNMLR